MNPFGSSADEKKTLTILFWIITPVLFFVFFRMFWVIFGLVYGGLVSWVLGLRFTAAIAVVSSLTALVFAILTCRYIYGQFKKHIIGDS